MEKITSPILLDSTGQEINETLKGIRDVLGTQVDDTTTSISKTWSSKKIVETFTQKQTSEGQTITCSPVAATPIIVSGDVEVGTVKLTHSNSEISTTYSLYVPAAGNFNWFTGILVLTNGEKVSLTPYPLMALQGENTLSIDKGTINVVYRGLVVSGGSTPEWSVIHGGNAAEEV